MVLRVCTIWGYHSGEFQPEYEDTRGLATSFIIHLFIRVQNNNGVVQLLIKKAH